MVGDSRDFRPALNLALRARAAVSQPQMPGGFYPHQGKPSAKAPTVADLQKRIIRQIGGGGAECPSQS
jgi:hypothetical protein